MIQKLSAVAATVLLLAVAPAAAQEVPEPAAKLEPAADALEAAADALEAAEDAVDAATTTLKPADKSLEDVLAAHFETIGGEEAWRAIETVQMNGTMAMAQMGIEAPVTMWFKSPDKTRMEFVVQGMTGVQAYDGETAWALMPFMGKPEPEALPAEMAEQFAEQADINPLLDWKDKGYELELAGIEEADGTEAYKIKLTRPSGNVRYYFLDTEHHLPFKVEGKTTFQGQEIDNTTTLGDYKEVGDLVFPHSMEIRQGSAENPPQVLTITSVEVGADIPDSTFDMEAAKPEPTEEQESEG